MKLEDPIGIALMWGIAIVIIVLALVFGGRTTSEPPDPSCVSSSYC